MAIKSSVDKIQISYEVDCIILMGNIKKSGAVSGLPRFRGGIRMKEVYGITFISLIIHKIIPHCGVSSPFIITPCGGFLFALITEQYFFKILNVPFEYNIMLFFL